MVEEVREPVGMCGFGSVGAACAMAAAASCSAALGMAALSAYPDPVARGLLAVAALAAWALAAVAAVPRGDAGHPAEGGRSAMGVAMLLVAALALAGGGAQLLLLAGGGLAAVLVAVMAACGLFEWGCAFYRAVYPFV